jgi:hypothetical protein
VGELEFQCGSAVLLGRSHFFLGSGPHEFPIPVVSHVPSGSLDTSLVSTDNINNPRTMNAVYNLLPRMELAKRWGRESLSGGELNNKQFNDFFHEGPLTSYFQQPNTVYTPRVLKDGSDSVGALEH